MPIWNYHNPVKIRFGPGALIGQGRTIPTGKRLLVTTAGMVSRGAVARLIKELADEEEWHVLDRVTPNPEISDLVSIRDELQDENFAAIVAFGGGSAIDTAKVLSVLLRTPATFDLRAQLEGKLAIPDVTPLPLFAIPTTSGTGAEVTPFATVWAAQEGKKFSFASTMLFPEAAWLDPEYSMDVPKEVTLSTGLDAFSQALESIWNKNANPYTLMLANRSASIGFRALEKLVEWPPTLGIRTDLMEASLLAGLAISHTRTALAHSMSYPITARYGMPHGLACSFTLPAILRFNAGVDDGRLADLAKHLGFANVDTLGEAVIHLYDALNIRCILDKYVSDSGQLKALIPDMFTPGRSDNNLRSVDTDALEAVLDMSSKFLSD